MPRRNIWLIALIGLLLASIALVIAYIAYLLLTIPESTTTITNVSLTPDDVYNGITAIEPPIESPDFTLTNQHNESINLSDLAGKPTLITFGFTHCPDICPITLSEMRTIHSSLGAQADDINYVFISVDGERDTPAVLRAYFELVQVDDFLVGMTGTPDVVRAIGETYGVDFIHHPPDENGNYNVDHTAGMFLLDSEGHWMRRYAYATTAALLVENIQSVLASGS